MALKIENLKKVRNRIADENNFFNMEIFGYDPEKYKGLYKNAPNCKTASCIAGWAQYEAHLEHGGIVHFYETYGDARSYLGINIKEADHIFYGQWSGNVLPSITREETIQYLDTVIQTGVVFQPTKKGEHLELE